MPVPDPGRVINPGLREVFGESDDFPEPVGGIRVPSRQEGHAVMYPDWASLGPEITGNADVNAVEVLREQSPVRDKPWLVPAVHFRPIKPFVGDIEGIRLNESCPILKRVNFGNPRGFGHRHVPDSRPVRPGFVMTAAEP